MACWYFAIVLCFSEYSRLASHMPQWAFRRWSDSCVIQNHQLLGGKCCGHLTAFKTGYLLTKITWLNSMQIPLQRLQVYCLM